MADDSYTLDSPINVRGTGTSSIFMQNASVTHNISTQGGEMTLGSNVDPDTLKLYSDGTSESKIFRLKKGSNTVTVLPADTPTSSYSFSFPSSPPSSSGQTIVSSLFGASSPYQFYDITARYVLVVRKNPGPGEYSSVAAALLSSQALAASDSERVVVHIYPGIYAEPAIVVPPYVFLVGEDMRAVKLTPLAMGYTLVSFSEMSGASFLSVKDTDPLFPAFQVVDAGDYVLIHKMELEGTARGISVRTTPAATKRTLLYIEYVGFVDPLVYAVECTDSNPISGFGSQVSLENFFNDGHSDSCIIVSGFNSEIFVHSTVLTGDGTGNGVEISQGGRANMRAVSLNAWNKGVTTIADGSTPTLMSAAILFEDCNDNIDIANSNTIGHFDGYTEYLKTKVPISAPFFVAEKDANIVTVSQKGGDFSSVAAALAAIVDASVTNRYSIFVGPGIYLEPHLSLKAYVAVIGFFQTQTILMATDPTQPFVSAAGWAGISRLTLTSRNPGFPPGVEPPYLIEYLGDPLGFHFRVDDCLFDTSSGTLHLGSTLGACLFVAMDPLVSMDASPTSIAYIEDSGSSNNPIVFLIDGLIWSAGPLGFTNMASAIDISSFKASATQPNIYGVFSDSTMGRAGMASPGDPSRAIKLSGSIFLTAESCFISGFGLGLEILPSVEQTRVICSSNIFSDNVADISIQSVNSTGSINVSAAISKISIVDGADFGVVINDPTGNVGLTGHLFQGTGWSTITNISEQVQQASVTGKIHDQVCIFPTTGLGATVNAGTGYVYVSGSLKYIQWPNTTITFLNNALNYVFVSSTGVVSVANSKPNFLSNIILGTVKTFGGTVTYVQQIGRLIDNLATNIDETLRTTLGPIADSGIIASPGSNLTSRSVNVSSGSYTLSVINYLPVGDTNISFLGYYAGGTAQIALAQVPLQYDLAGVLTNIPIGKYAKHSLHILTELSGASTYYLVYGQILFDTELDADNGPLPLPPSFFGGNMCPISAIVVTSGDPASPLPVGRFRDIRPTLAFRSGGVTASADHNSLLNLTAGDAHPQYFRTDGSRVMTGDIQLGTFDITGAGGNLLNGIDIASHALRHVPGGPDPLPTAAPVSVGAVNSIGVAGSFSRSDHVHSHGVQTDPTFHTLVTASAAGFMSSADFSKLASATTLAIPNTIMSRNSSAGTQVRSLIFPNVANTNLLTFQIQTPSFSGPDHVINIPVPVGDDVLVYENYAQTLSNKNLVDLSTFVVSSADPTKRARFSASGLTVDRVFTFPDESTVLVGTGATQTLTNKNISGATNTVEATALRTTTGAVTVNTSVSPTAGQTLVAVSATEASWQTPASGSVTSITAGTGLSGGTITSSGTISLTVPVAANLGGTNSTAALAGGRVMISSAGAIIEAPALTNGQLLIGRTGNSPLGANLTGTTSQVIVTSASGAITLSTPQNIAVTSTPTFARMTLTATTSQLVLGTTRTITINAPTPATASRVYSYPDSGADDAIVMGLAVQTLTNKTIAGSTNYVEAAGLRTTGAAVVISASAPPVIGQALIATSATTATWQSVAAASGKITFVTNTPLTGAALVGLGETLTLGVGDGQIANVKLQNSGVTINTSSPLQGGGLVNLGGTLTLSLVPGSISNGNLQNSSITINTGQGLSGGGTVALGGNLTLQILNGAITNALLQNRNITVSTSNGLTGAATVDLGTTLALGIAAGGIANDRLVNPFIGITAQGGLQGSGGSVQLGTGVILSIAPGGVTNSMLANPTSSITAGAGLTGGSPTFALGGSIVFSIPNGAVTTAMLATPNISTILSGGITGSSTFAPGGTLSLGLSNVQNSSLQNSSVTINSGAGLSGGGVVALGGTLNLSIPSAAVTNTMLVNSSVSLTAGSGLSGGGTVVLGGSATFQISPGGVTNAMLSNSSVTINTVQGLSGGGSLSLGGTLSLSIPNGGVSNIMLANSSLTISPGTGLSGGGTVTLGGTSTLNLTNTGVTAASYTRANITVDAQGRITAAASGTAVTSVDLSAPSEFLVAGSPITSSGTLTVTKATQLANRVWAGPVSGGAAEPNFRALVLGDIPATATPKTITASIALTSITVATLNLGYVPWEQTELGAYNTRKVSTWFTTSNLVAITVTISVLRSTDNAVMGSLVIPGNSVSGIYSFSITNPGVNCYLIFRVVRVGTGTNPTLAGMVMYLS